MMRSTQNSPLMPSSLYWLRQVDAKNDISLENQQSASYLNKISFFLISYELLQFMYDLGVGVPNYQPILLISHFLMKNRYVL